MVHIFPYHGRHYHKIQYGRWKCGKKCHITMEHYVSENHSLERKQMNVLCYLPSEKTLNETI